MAKKPTTPKAETVEAAAVAEIAAPKFAPCRQCGNPADCERANRCVKGFK